MEHVDAADRRLQTEPIAGKGSADWLAHRAELSTEQERRLSQIDGILSVANLALLTEQQPPPGFSPSPLRLPFPGRPYDHVRGYYRNKHAKDFDDDQGIDRPVRGAGIVADDGTLKPSAVLPGVDLSETQVARLLALAERTVPEGRENCGCGPVTPSHYFVFYDSKNRPFAQLSLELAFGGRTYESVHSRFASFGRQVTREALEDFKKLCAELGMGFCRDEADNAARTEWGRRHTDTASSEEPRYKPEPLGIEPSKELLAMTPLERRHLCVWAWDNASRWISSDPRKGHTGWLQRIDPNSQGVGDVWSIRKMYWDECVRRFPKCRKPLEEVLPCVEATQQRSPLVKEEVPQCTQLLPCVWGFEIRRGEDPAHAVRLTP